MIDGVEIALDRRGEDLPEDEGDEQDGGDSDRAAREPPAEPGIEPGEGIDIPRLEDGEDGESIDEDGDNGGQDGQVAVGARLERRKPALEVGADRETAPAGALHQVDDEPCCDEDE